MIYYIPIVLALFGIWALMKTASKKPPAKNSEPIEIWAKRVARKLDGKG